MTRVTISGDGSYNVYVKVNRRSNNRKKSTKSISRRPLTIRQQLASPLRDSEKHKPVVEQLMMEL